MVPPNVVARGGAGWCGALVGARPHGAPLLACLPKTVRVAEGVQGVPVTHGFAAVPNLSLVAPPAMPDARPKLSTPLLDALARVARW